MWFLRTWLGKLPNDLEVYSWVFIIELNGGFPSKPRTLLKGDQETFFI